MSDYLTNLVVRSFEPTLAIQPRSPSLFEPTHSGDPTLVEQSAEHKPPEARAVPPHLIKASSVASSEPPMDQPSSRAAQPAPERITKLSPSSTLSTQAPHPRGTKALDPEPSAASYITAVTPLSGIRRPPQPLALESPTAPIGIEGIEPSTQPPAATEHVVSPAPPVTQRDTRSAPLAMRKPVYSKPTKVVVEPKVIARTGSRPGAVNVPAPEKKVAPTIRVNIGRIEVRAIMPPMPPAQIGRHSAVLPLDEYLKGRNTGGRR